MIYGAGAIGATIGARLHQHGRDVTLIPRGSHLRAIARRGLTFATPDGDGQLSIAVVANPSEAELQPGDLVVLAMKGQDTRSAVADLVAVAPDVAVACAQNGVENERIALRCFQQVYALRVSVAATHLEPGVVMSHGAPLTGIVDAGCYPRGVDATARTVADDLGASTFSSVAIGDIMRWKYAKLLSNLGNAVEAVCSWRPGLRDGEVARLCRAEATACYRAAGVAWASDEEDRARRDGNMSLRPVRGQRHQGASSWQSVLRGMPVETDYLNGEIVLLGRLHGVPTPMNALLQRVAADVGGRAPRPGPLNEEDLLAMLHANGDPGRVAESAPFQDRPQGTT